MNLSEPLPVHVTITTGFTCTRASSTFDNHIDRKDDLTTRAIPLHRGVHATERLLELCVTCVVFFELRLFLHHGYSNPAGGSSESDRISALGQERVTDNQAANWCQAVYADDVQAGGYEVFGYGGK